MERNTLQSAIDTFGRDFNIDMCIEECAELIAVLNHYRRGKASVCDVLSELVDTRIMTDVALEIFDGQTDYATYLTIKKQKTVRLLARIENEETRKIHSSGRVVNEEARP